MAEKCKEQKSDGLEITSIGKLYSGQWDKKYWSSSRGKDRYPYPIGYNALRTQNGVTYKMEIHEGLNGPLFTISSTDGQSCSGQTPDIVWESFQKRGCQIKLLHGKRFSCKIDGVEFFGFKNTFVQRLLRELVANISATPEHYFSSSKSLRNETSEVVNRTEDMGSKTDPNLLKQVVTPQVTGKRNGKGRINNAKSAASTSLKKPRGENKNCNIKALNSVQQEYGEHPLPISVNKRSCSSSEALQESESSHTIIQREAALGPVESFDKDDHLKVESLSSQGERKHLNPEAEVPLESIRVTGKRNRKGRINNVKPAANSSLKKPRHQNENYNTEALDFGQQDYGEHPPPIYANEGSCNSSEELQESESLHTIIEREKVLVPVKSFDKNDLKVESPKGERKHLNPETKVLLESIPQVMGKRNRKGRINKVKSAANCSLKKPRCQNKNCNTKALNFGQQDYGEHPPPISANKGSCNSSEALQESESLHTIIEREKVVVPVEAFDKVDHLKVESPGSQGERKHLNPEPGVPLAESTKLQKDGKLFDRSKVMEQRVIKSQMTEDKDEELPVKNQMQIISDANIWAPDTLDHPSDDSFNVTTEIVKDDEAAVTTAVSDSLKIDSHPENEMDTSRLEVNSERSESDSVGYEIASSMMTVLLPRALPLLTTYTRKKKKSPEISVNKFQDKNKKIDLCLDSTSVNGLGDSSLHKQKKENTNFPVRCYVPASTACSLAESVVPDSFDNAEGGYTPSQGLPQILQVAEVAKGDQSVLGLQTCRCEIKGPSKNNNLEAKLSVCKDETGIERENYFLSSTQKLVQASKKEIGGTQRTDAIVRRGLTNILPAEPMAERVFLSESIVCRDFKDDSVPETCANINAMHRSHLVQGSSSKQQQIKQSISVNEPCIDERLLSFHTKETPTITSGAPSNMAFRSQNKEMDWMSNHIQTSRSLDSTTIISEGNLAEKLSRDQHFVRFTSLSLHKENQKLKFSADTTEKKENNENVNMEAQKDLKTEGERSGVLELIAGYAHPMPVSSVLLSPQENDLYICVLCGQPLHADRTIFMYKVPIAGEERGCPSFIGHVSISFLFPEGAFGGDIELDTAAVQLTPIGQLLVFNSVKAPNCREGDIKCQCSLCASKNFEENAVKVVQLRNGYVSLITKLKTTQRICCILVCPPDHLVAVDESGKLYIWVMNSKWSAETEECCLLLPDCTPFSSMKLKRVPNFASLVVGYNGFGEFNLWDINKRMLVSKFSAAHTSVFQCIPVSLFRWQRRFIVPAGVTEETINEITNATKMSFLESSDNRSFCSLEDKDVAVWLLISTAPEPNWPAYQSSEHQSDPSNWWRLALMVNNTVIMGNSLDPRTSAIGFSSGCGVIGRSDGVVYMWEVATGKKLQNLHHFKDSAVSCIATDELNHRAVAIASDGGQLLVYLRS